MILRILAFVAVGWLVLHILLAGYASKIPSLGKPPIPWPALVLAKASAAVSLCLMMWTAASERAALPAFSAAVFIVLLTGGMLLITPALYNLGKHLRMGLPAEETTLVTTGAYRFSRNPMYVGLFCYLGASLLYAFSWINLAAAVTAVFLHHRIVLAEEKFLAGRFQDYEEYRSRVRRYL